MAIIYESGLILYTHHFKHDSMSREAVITGAINDGLAGTNAQQAANDLQGVAVASLIPYLDSNVQLMRTTTLRGNGTAFFTVGTSSAAPTRGTNAASSTTPNTGVLVQKRTALGGRTGRGRWYLPWFLNEGQVDETGLVASTYVTGVQGAITNYFNSLTPKLVIANRIYDLPWDNPNRQLQQVNGGPIVTSMVVQPFAATQRRRMPRA